MIRINYYCNFLNEMRSLFVGSEKAMDEEVERLNKLEYTIHSIELPSDDTWDTSTSAYSRLSNAVGTKTTKEA